MTGQDSWSNPILTARTPRPDRDTPPTRRSQHRDTRRATQAAIPAASPHRRTRRENLIAVIGNPLDDQNAFTFADGVTVGRVVRARLERGTVGNRVDIKTLMSRKDAAVDLPGDHSRKNEEELKAARFTHAPDTGLLVLYAIDKDSRTSRKSRQDLAAPEHVIGVGLVFPNPRDGDAEAHGYIQADLSGISIEDEDYSALEADE